MTALVGITGAKGVLGRRYSEIAARAGNVVLPFDGDIRDQKAVQHWVDVQKPEFVVHCAALVDVAHAEADPQLALAVNVGGTMNLVTSLRNSKRHAWLFCASSSHVYAPLKRPLLEEDEIGPRSFYALTKYLAEETALKLLKDSAIHLCIGRIFSLFDEIQRGGYLYPSTAARLQNHDFSTPFIVRDGHAVRDFSSASDIAQMIEALRIRKGTGVVNLGSGIGSSVIEQLGRLFGEHITFATDGSANATSIVANISRLEALVSDKA